MSDHPTTDPVPARDAALEALAGAANARAVRIASIGIALSAIVAELADDVLEEMDQVQGALRDLDQFLSWNHLAAGARAVEYCAESVTNSAEQLRAHIGAPTVAALATATARLREVHERELREAEGRWKLINERLQSATLAGIIARLGALRTAIGRIEARLDLESEALRLVEARAAHGGWP